MSTRHCSGFNKRACLQFKRTCEWDDDKHTCSTLSPLEVATRLGGTLQRAPVSGMDCAQVYRDDAEAGYVCWETNDDDDSDNGDGDVCDSAINVFTMERLNTPGRRLVVLQFEEGFAVCHDAENLLSFWDMPDARAVEYKPTNPDIIPHSEGYGSRPALLSPLYFKEPRNGTFVHAGVRRAILQNADVMRVVVRVKYAPDRVRLGNIDGVFGMSMLHGQAPGEVVVVEAPLAGRRPTRLDPVEDFLLPPAPTVRRSTRLAERAARPSSPRAGIERARGRFGLFSRENSNEEDAWDNGDDSELSPVLLRPGFGRWSPHDDRQGLRALLPQVAIVRGDTLQTPLDDDQETEDEDDGAGAPRS